MNARNYRNFSERQFLFRNNIAKNLSSPNLDYGCGNGTSTLVIALELPNLSIVGYDPNSKEIVEARRLVELSGLREVKFTDSLEDLRNYAFRSSTANFVYHENPDLFKEIFPLIVPGGKVCILDYNLKGVTMREFKKNFCCDNERRILKDEGLEACFERHTSTNIKDCMNSAKEAGFTPSEMCTTDHYFALVAEKK